MAELGRNRVNPQHLQSTQHGLFHKGTAQMHFNVNSIILPRVANCATLVTLFLAITHAVSKSAFYLFNMIIGCHTIIYSNDSEKDRAFFRDVLGMKSVDAGHGWLIFAMPPAELAFHPVEGREFHKLYLMCDNLSATIAELTEKGVICNKIHEERWGRLTQISLPGGSKLGLYEPKHPLAIGA
jgi:predicted enzyme related to lactoylglutathione lyase